MPSTLSSRSLSLVVESDPFEYPRLRNLLQYAWLPDHADIQRVRSSREALPFLEDRDIDAILVSATTGLEDALALLRQTRGMAEPVPVVITGAENSRRSVDAFRTGAADFVTSDSLSSARLRVALRRAVALGERDRMLMRALRGWRSRQASELRQEQSEGAF
jgi:DNA-binding NtrC family response regulator